MNVKINCRLVVFVEKNLNQNPFFTVIVLHILQVKSTYVASAISHSIQIIN